MLCRATRRLAPEAIKFRIRIHWFRNRLNKCWGLLDTEQDGRILWNITHDLEVLTD